MNARQRIELKRSQSRGRLGVIAMLDGEAVTTEIRTERDALLAELRESEPQLQAAIVAEAKDSAERREAGGEGTERRELIAKSELRNYVSAAVTQSQLSGPESELAAACPVSDQVKGQGGVGVPWEAISRKDRPKDEQRADASTALPSAGVQTVEQGFAGRVFAEGAAAFLGVGMVDVPIGEASYFILSAGTAPAFTDAGGVHDATAATLSGKVLEPKRLSAAYVLRLEDLARSAMLEEALRMDLAGALRESLDSAVVKGAANGPDGFLTAGVLPAVPDAAKSEKTFAGFISIAGGGVDGRFARNLREVRLMLAPQSYKAAASALASNGQVSGSDYLLERSGGLVASALIPAPASEIQGGLLSRVGVMGNATAALWSGVSLQIRDEFTKASSGEVRLTAIALFDFAVLRKDAFSAFKVDLS